MPSTLYSSANMTRLLKDAVILLGTLSTIAAAATCGAGSQCPEDSPCCSQYGNCGTGAFCLGGCDPVHSFSLGSCAPEPVCQDRDITFTNMDRLISSDKYLGDSSKADFVYDGQPLIHNDALLLTMAQNSSGTLIASTDYIWYGKVSANLTTSGGQGVVTAFILLSDVKDEIDFEFVGYNLTQAQTNYYFQGIADYTHGGNSSVPAGDSFKDWHVYTLDWQPDTTTWSIDGNIVRTLKKSDTYNSTTNSYMYPQTPARLEASVWPAGSPTNAPGTVAWAGGDIQWNNPNYMVNDYYFASFSSINIQCYNPPQGANASGKNSYVYNGPSGLNDTVAIVDDKTILGSFEATGLNMSAGASASTSASANVPTQGSSGTGQNGNRGGSGGSDSSSNGDGSSSGTSTTSSGGSATSGFVQGSGSSGKNAAGPQLSAPSGVILQGALLAGLVVVGGMAML